MQSVETSAMVAFGSEKTGSQPSISNHYSPSAIDNLAAVASNATSGLVLKKEMFKRCTTLLGRRRMVGW